VQQSSPLPPSAAKRAQRTLLESRLGLRFGGVWKPEASAHLREAGGYPFKTLTDLTGQRNHRPCPRNAKNRLSPRTIDSRFPRRSPGATDETTTYLPVDLSTFVLKLQLWLNYITYKE